MLCVRDTLRVELCVQPLFYVIEMGVTVHR